MPANPPFTLVVGYHIYESLLWQLGPGMLHLHPPPGMTIHVFHPFSSMAGGLMSTGHLFAMLANLFSTSPPALSTGLKIPVRHSPFQQFLKWLPPTSLVPLYIPSIISLFRWDSLSLSPLPISVICSQRLTPVSSTVRPLRSDGDASFISRSL